MTQDPVCGMQLDEQTAEARAEHRGHNYDFCSEECKEQFEQNLARYGRQTA